MGAPWYKQTKNYKLERKVKTHKGLAIPFFIIGPLLMVGSFVFILYLLNETNIKMYEFERIGEVVKSHIPVLYVILAGFLLLIFAIINAGIRKSTDKKMRHYYPERGVERKYEYDGRRVRVTYNVEQNNHKYSETANVIQDIINDGFTEFIYYKVEKRGEDRIFHFVFDTKLSSEELIAQSNRLLEKAQGGNPQMPDYYSERPRYHGKNIKYDTSHSTGGGYTETTKTYKGDTLIKTESKSYHKSSHYFEWVFLYVDENDEPLRTKSGVDFIYETDVSISFDVRD